jgi:hypothetical protein
MLSKKIFQKSILNFKINTLEINSFKPIFGKFPKCHFTRQSSNKTKSIKPTKESDEDVKTINVIKEDIPMKINPYFSKALADKDKVNINVASSTEEDEYLKASAFRDILSKDQKDQIVKVKQKLTAARSKKSKKIGVMVENIKRELPKEL